MYIINVTIKFFIAITQAIRTSTAIFTNTYYCQKIPAQQWAMQPKHDPWEPHIYYN